MKFGRAGWFAKGVVYVLAGGLALLVVGRSFGWSEREGRRQGQASPTGAIKEVAQSTGGPLLLVALAVGMFLYAAWRVATAVLPGSTDAEGLATRVGYGVSAILYTTFGVTAIALARSPREGQRQQDGQRHDQPTHAAHRRPVAHRHRRRAHDRRRYLPLHEGPEVRRHRRRRHERHVVRAPNATRRLGAVGEIGRGIAMGLIGFFLVRAAVTFKAAEATGLDGALRRLALESWGVLVVAVVGLGLIAYGLFCLATFTRRRLQLPDREADTALPGGAMMSHAHR